MARNNRPNKRQRRARKKAKALRKQQFMSNVAEGPTKAEQRNGKERTAADIIANMQGLTHLTTVNVDGHAQRFEPIDTIYGTEYRVINPKGIRTLHSWRATAKDKPQSRRHKGA